MDIYEFIRTEDDRLVQLMHKIADKSVSGDVRELLLNQARIQFGALAHVEGEHFYPALEMYEQTKATAAAHRDMNRTIRTALDALDGADLDDPDNAELLESLPGKVEDFVKSKEKKLFSEVKGVIPEDLAQGLGRAAQEDMNVHRRKLAGEKG